MKGPLSPTMLKALALAREGGGRLEYEVGGYWVKPGTPMIRKPWPVPDGPYVGIATVRALKKRGMVEETRISPRYRMADQVTVTEPGYRALLEAKI